MTLSEFKAWLQGFSHNMGAYPDEEEWAEILLMLSEVRDSVQHVPTVSVPSVNLPFVTTNPWTKTLVCSNTSG